MRDFKETDDIHLCFENKPTMFNSTASNQILYPPNIIEVKEPIIFLAGPIQGSSAWHEIAIAHLRLQVNSVCIACPKVQDFNDVHFDFAKQIDWETHYLRQAARYGVILFWLAKESTHLCQRAYAQTTRFELGEWLTRASFDNTALVVGIEEGFSGAKYIRHRLHQQSRSAYTSLEETCHAAIDLYQEQEHKNNYDWVVKKRCSE